MRYICALTIAGSDCSGGAGIQADIKTMSALGVYAATAITSITVQNTKGVQAVHGVNPLIVTDQIKAVMDDLKPDAVKIGMVNDCATISISSMVFIFMLDNISASGRLGVSRVDIGSKESQNSSKASGFIR